MKRHSPILLALGRRRVSFRQFAMYRGDELLQGRAFVGFDQQ